MTKPESKNINKKTDSVKDVNNDPKTSGTHYSLYIIPNKVIKYYESQSDTQDLTNMWKDLCDGFQESCQISVLVDSFKRITKRGIYSAEELEHVFKNYAILYEKDKIASKYANETTPNQTKELVSKYANQEIIVGVALFDKPYTADELAPGWEDASRWITGGTGERDEETIYFTAVEQLKLIDTMFFYSECEILRKMKQ